MIKYEELPKKFRLKFGSSEWYEQDASGKVILTQYTDKHFKSGDFTKDSLIFSMIEKGVLEVVPLTTKKWVVFMFTDCELEDKRYMGYIPEEHKTCFLSYFKSEIKGVEIQYWSSFELIPRNLSVKKLELYPTMFSLYAEEVEVD